MGCPAYRAGGGCHAQARARGSHISACGVSVAPCHPGQAKKPTGYLSKIDSYGRARVSSSPSKVGCHANRAGGGCHARARARRSQNSARGVSMAPWHPGQAIIPTGYLSKISSYGRAHVSLSPSTVRVPREPRWRRLPRPTSKFTNCKLPPNCYYSSTNYRRGRPGGDHDY